MEIGKSRGKDGVCSLGGNMWVISSSAQDLTGEPELELRVVLGCERRGSPALSPSD